MGNQPGLLTVAREKMLGRQPGDRSTGLNLSQRGRDLIYRKWHLVRPAEARIVWRLHGAYTNRKA
jgi:hypothetical protein